MTRPRTLWILGSIGIVMYAAVAWIFWTDAVFDTSGMVRKLLIGIIGVLTVAYFLGIAVVRHVSMRTIVFFGVLFALLGFISGPVDSTDLYYYMAQGWQQSHYGANPYSRVLRDIPDGTSDPLIASPWMRLNRNPWLDEPMPYGFAFASLTRAVAWLGNGNWWLTFFLFDGLNLLFHAAVSLLLWKTASHIPQANPKLVLYLYAWSPLVVLQFLADAHNDLMMAAFILLAFYLWLKERPAWVLPCIVVAGLMKYLALALIPFVICLIARRYGWKSAAKSALASISLTAVLSGPYIRDLKSFKVRQVFEQLTEQTGSLHAFLRFGYRTIARLVQSGPVDLDRFSAAANVLLWMAVGIYALYRLKRAWPGNEDSPVDVASRWTAVLFMIVFVGSSQFYPWYIGMLFPLSLVGIGAGVLADLIVLLSGTHMAFGFLRSKAVGYFLLTTAIPIAFVMWQYRKEKAVIR